VLLRGGTVVDATGSRLADVLVKGEIIVSVEAGAGPGAAPPGTVELDAGE